MTTFGEHAAHPKNMKRLAEPSGVGRASIDGEPVYLQIAIKAVDGIVVETSFDAFLCGFAIGLCSMLTERIKGLTLNEAERVSAEELLVECPGIPEGKRDYARTAIDALRAAVNQAQPNPLPLIQN